MRDRFLSKSPIAIQRPMLNAGHAERGDTGRVHMIKLAQAREIIEIILYVWVHPDDDDRR